MANEMTTTAADSVRCPVCLEDFQPDTINGHLDACLLKGDTDCSSPTTTDGNGPPGKKFCAKASPRNPIFKSTAVSSCNTSGTPSFALLSKTNKSNSSPHSERKTLFPSKQTGVTVANRGIKRGLLNELDPGPTGGEHLKSQPSVSNTETMKTQDLSPQTLLTMNKPLAEVLRPNTLEEYFGQSKVVGQQTLLRSLLDSQEVPSLILWGPPGCGKVQM